MRIHFFCTLMLFAAILQLSGCSYNSAPDPNTTAGTAATAPPAPVDQVAPGETDDDIPGVDVADGNDFVPLPLGEDESDVATLTIGDVAPPIAIAKWVKGDPITSFEAGKVYVVEFWATWCGPCRQSMPHISSLQNQYGDQVHFMGISDETEDIVQDFMGGPQEGDVTWDQAITYRIALDQDQQTSMNYMRAAGQGGIPTAFIVGKDGHVEWIGHPMTMDQPLAEIVGGTYDRAAAREQFELAAKAQRLQEQIMPQLNQAFGAQDWDKALQLVGTLEEQLPGDPRIMHIKMMILQRAGRVEELSAILSGLIDSVWDQAMPLNQLAWNIVSGPEPRNLELALKAVKRASELNNGEDGSTLDTMARVHYLMGDLDTAIELQKKAVELEPIEQIKETLQQYEAEKAGGAADPGAGLPAVPDAEANTDN